MKLYMTPRIEVNGSTLLSFALEYLWKFEDEVAEEIVQGINRPLNPEEQAAYDEHMVYVNSVKSYEN